jgi:hypothetical protein
MPSRNFACIALGDRPMIAAADALPISEPIYYYYYFQCHFLRR